MVFSSAAHKSWAYQDFLAGFAFNLSLYILQKCNSGSVQISLGDRRKLWEQVASTALGLNRRWQHFNIIRHLYVQHTHTGTMAMIIGFFFKFLVGNLQFHAYCSKGTEHNVMRGLFGYDNTGHFQDPLAKYTADRKVWHWAETSTIVSESALFSVLS